jgi:hypothetical protein
MLVANIVHPNTLLEIKLIRKEPSREAASNILIVVFSGCLALTITAMFLLLTASAWRQKKTRSTTQPCGQIPCQNCRFFKEENQYLICAVHPDIVLT